MNVSIRIHVIYLQSSEIVLRPPHGASRFRSSAGLYFYGRIRRSDWIPVGARKPHWQLRRSVASLSSDSVHEFVRSQDDIFASCHLVRTVCVHVCIYGLVYVGFPESLSVYM